MSNEQSIDYIKNGGHLLEVIIIVPVLAAHDPVLAAHDYCSTCCYRYHYDWQYMYMFLRSLNCSQCTCIYVYALYMYCLNTCNCKFK